MGSSTTKTNKSPNSNTKDEEFCRLPAELAKPIHYEIYMRPNLETFKFEANETIYVEVSAWGALNKISIVCSRRGGGGKFSTQFTL